MPKYLDPATRSVAVAVVVLVLALILYRHPASAKTPLAT
jgi:hypothetical protein